MTITLDKAVKQANLVLLHANAFEALNRLARSAGATIPVWNLEGLVFVNDPALKLMQKTQEGLEEIVEETGRELTEMGIDLEAPTTPGDGGLNADA